MTYSAQAISIDDSLVHRSERVTWLLIGIVAISIVDLVLTITYLTSVGMSEGNPIALWLLRLTNSVWPLAVYKIITVAICVTLLYRTRFRRESELAAWCAMLILCALAVWWNQYTRYQPNLPVGENHIVMIDGKMYQPIPFSEKRWVLN